ncbi:gamma-butyrobetaine,2-oxoglutarate dioxygenase [Loktanella sp. D2R18]|uniref:TauD/TfdA family dioxygenase n=1 Tax=Rhodobacterales TaxID=204455 RepID=UPI000DEBA40A|nr:MULTISPECIES: TauD/TfdA family dioxygenase [Rhodobacterales]MDO6591624.1 TauD/TfdA family dioxygenase [Yoonia sp. 1_MG-2023]RBW43740.1 gamma-butyrobetaine,2-oxoglutarate dioxygenase [Loktanella sp. D2R18]
MMNTQFELQDNGVIVPLSSGPKYFNYYWLRDASNSSIDPQTRERIFDVSQLASAPKAQALSVKDDMLVIDWEAEDCPSEVPLALLESVATTGRAADVAAIPRKVWYSDHLPNIPRIPQAEVINTAAGRAELTRALIEDGIAIVTEMEPTEDSLPNLVKAIGPVTPSGEGLFFNVRVEIEPTNLAFTAGPLEMHTDLPGEEAAPGVQFLHCLENTVDGGLSLFLDGVAVAMALKEEDPDAFDMLAAHKIPFFYRHDKIDYRSHQRVIETDQDGNVTGVTISQHLQDNMDLPQDLLDRYYPAFIKFIRMMQEDRFLLKFKSEAGNCVVFDNHRIVHGREGYVADSGSRHLRGCYTDRAAMRSTYRIASKSA